MTLESLAYYLGFYIGVSGLPLLVIVGFAGTGAQAIRRCVIGSIVVAGLALLPLAVSETSTSFGILVGVILALPTVAFRNRMRRQTEDSQEGTSELRTANEIATETLPLASQPVKSKSVHAQMHRIVELSRSSKAWILLAVIVALAFLANSTRYKPIDGVLMWDRWGHRLCRASITQEMKCGKAWWD